MATTTTYSFPSVEVIGGRNVLEQIGALAALAFVFLFVSRIAESAAFLHLPLLTAALGLLAMAASGAWMAAIKTRVAVIYALLTLLMLGGVPFGVWPGGAVDTIVYHWFQAVIASLLVMAAIVSFRQVSTLLNLIAWAVLLAALFGLREGVSSVEGRLVIGNGRFGNPNDLAFVLLLGLPLWLRRMCEGRPGPFRRIASAGALAAILVCFLKTGSRAGLFALAVMLVLLFLRLSLSGKIALGLVAGTVFTVSFAVMPAYLRQRYFTFQSAAVDNLQTRVGRFSVGAAAASATQRQQNLTDSLKITLHHPVFGVGAGNFPVAQDQNARAAGRRRGSWLGTHNTYTQISSECGVPALLLFLALLGVSLKTLAAARKRASQDPRPLAREMRQAVLAMEAIMWASCAFLFSAHMAYDITPYLLVALCFVLGRAVERELGPDSAPTAAGQNWARFRLAGSVR